MERVWKRTVAGAVGGLALIGVLWWALSGREDPRTLALGEWKEASTRLYVEVGADTVTARGLGRGTIRYEWLQTEKAPYRMKITYRGASYDVLVSFDGKDRAIVEPQVWEMMPDYAQSQLRDINRRHKRPEKELRLLFLRRPQKGDSH